MIPVDVYRVGVAEAFRTHNWGRSLRYLSIQLRARNWRAVRNHLKGIRAEHSMCSHNVGSAWFSERAAMRRASRLCTAAS